MRLTLSEIEALERRYRADLFNSLSGVKSANLLGTISTHGQTNLSIVNSVVHIGANPPLMGYIQRPTTVERHTFENIVATNQFTINSIQEDFILKAHQTAARYARNNSEFDQVQLTPFFDNELKAPYVQESILKIGLSLEDIIPIKSNDTKLVIGKVQVLHLPDDFVDKDGHFRLYDTSIVGINGLDTYVSTQKIKRFSYAKPDEALKEL